jgi:hypothetical protein
VGITRARRLLGITFADMRFGQTSSPSQFLYELARKERHCYVWTNPEESGADQRLPLLSNRERQRLIEGPSPGQPAAPSPNRRAAPPDKQQAQVGTNNVAAAPLRHGLSWSAAEDDQLRVAFHAGDAIAAIASAHERKIGAITARLVRLGLISEDGVIASG